MAPTQALVTHGLAESDLLELYRRMVLLRTYDERSVVYHRQGRIGTYAIFWNHEAIQAGATFALSGDDWIFPSYRQSAIRAGAARADVAPRPPRRRARRGEEAPRGAGGGDGVLRRRRDERGRVPRGDQP